MESRQYMDMAGVLPGDGYELRKPKHEVKVNAKAIARVGGIDAMVQRLIGVWLSMPETYREIGLHWYDEGHEFAVQIANTYDFTTWQIAQVISAISPKNPWSGKFDKDGKQWADGNKLCALKIVKAFREGGSDAALAIKGWGYSGSFVRKAIAALQNEDIDWSKAPKTHRFALLLDNPKRDNICVCDSHASRIATGNLGDRYHVVEASAYFLIEQAYMIASEILGIPAYVLQAGTWQYAVDGHLYGQGEIE